MSATMPAGGLDFSRHSCTSGTAADMNENEGDENGTMRQQIRRSSLAGSHHGRLSIGTDSHSSLGWESKPGSLSAEITQKIFPYHVMVNYNFDITQVGTNLPRLLSKESDRELIGSPVADILKIAKPIGATWEWDWLRKLEDQTFTVELADEDLEYVRFKASVVRTSESRVEAMLVLSPDANSLDELRDMRLTLSDLPAHGAYRDAVFLREHLSTQMNNALRMEKLSRNLKREKALLEELLPEHAAEGLRNGRAVEPMIHRNVTMFFSDIVGFTNICKNLYPWEVIAMLNRLYSVMDFLAKKFKLFKVSTFANMARLSSLSLLTYDVFVVNIRSKLLAMPTFAVVVCRKRTTNTHKTLPTLPWQYSIVPKWSSRPLTMLLSSFELASTQALVRVV